MTQKDFASPSMSVKDKLGSLTPPMFPNECPIARVLGIPLTVYAYAEAKPGESPSKGDLNFVAMLLTRKLDGSQRTIRGKALVCIDQEIAGNAPNLDVEFDLIVKLLFFTGDLLKDTIGHIKGEELVKKLNTSRIFFQFYGPGRHVVKKMTELHVQDPSKGPQSPTQVLTLSMLEQQMKAIHAKNMQQQRQQRMPVFMQEKYMQDKEYLGELQKIVLRGWKAPSSTGHDEEGDDQTKSGESEKKNQSSDELDFSDLN
eukprot:CAMPEP_0114351070 /NCGR_PEP_ID=MMETSP0101-20121206/16888_1 /TAXON_ID=38822 ORGANISM="Pteridomonas danica, Strain PT" /NCGR_SAMPLE_ID=MMETSP0101 /ASSEMBLY_ACC=CAM_ASM_000211 /LENGTH=256 /DNA_ID=CAMNT_0001490723 /DNA_START=114 /DNA_END=884 /DNA_ORIENTATION=-